MLKCSTKLLCEKTRMEEYMFDTCIRWRTESRSCSCQQRFEIESTRTFFLASAFSSTQTGNSNSLRLI